MDQLLNLQMCREAMEISDQTPEVVITTPLTETSVRQTLGEVVRETGALEGAELYLKVGRRVARIENQT